MNRTGPHKIFTWIFFALSMLVLAQTAGFGQKIKTISVNGALFEIDREKQIYKLKTTQNLDVILNWKGDFLLGDDVVSRFSLRSGDQINAEIIPGRQVINMPEVTGEYLSDRLIFINDKKFLTAGGRQVYFSKKAVFLKNSLPCNVDQIKPGLRVYARINPVTRLAGSLEAIDLSNLLLKQRNPQSWIGRIDVQSTNKSGKILSLRKGDTLEVTADLKTAGNARVYFDIAGIARQVPMTRIKSGKYRGKFKLVRGDARRTYVTVRAVDAKGTISKLNPLSIDAASSGPTIIPVNPKLGGKVSEKEIVILARFKPGGSLIRAETARVFIDGKKVDRVTARTVDFLTAKLPNNISEGKHRVKVKVADQAGNVSSRTWHFFNTPGDENERNF